MPPRPADDQHDAIPDTEPPGSSPALPPLPPLSSLVTFPGYEVLRELGRGGMGVVYLARHLAFDRLEVLKVVEAGPVNREAFRRRFTEEIRAAARVQHTNIVIPYQTFTAGAAQVLAMEYIDGCNLDELVRRNKGPLPIAHACAFARQVAQGLQKAHEKGLVHRDIKPGNLMLSREGVVKIVDFGLAKAVREQGDNEALTDTGQMMGTPHFMAPEQGLDAKSADIRADIYSLGCTLDFLLTGTFLFSGGGLQVVLAHQNQPPPPLAARRPDVPAGLAALVARLLAKGPEDRPQTPGEVAQALAPFCTKVVAPREIINSIGMKLVLIPPGTFKMDSPEDEEGRDDDEHQHEVWITRPFYLGAYQVTQGEFKAVMGYNPSYFSKDGTKRAGATYNYGDPARGKAKVAGLDTADFPVENVSWDEAVEFCKKLTEKERNERKIGREQEYRLPTEAQWEYSCRGGAASYQTFHTGNKLSSKQANFDGNFPYGGADKGDYLQRTTKVGSYSPNKYGLYDMHGNAWEWCADWFDRGTYKTGPFPRIDPQGPSEGSIRVVRGGGWGDYGRYCRSACRSSSGPAVRSSGLGFRVSLVPSGG